MNPSRFVRTLSRVVPKRVCISRGRLLFTVALFVANKATGLAQEKKFEIIVTLSSAAGDMRCGACALQLEDWPQGRILATVPAFGAQYRFSAPGPGAYIIRGDMVGFAQIQEKVELDAVSPSRTYITIAPKPIAPKPAISPPSNSVVDISTLTPVYPKKAVELYQKALNDSRKQKTREAIGLFEEAIRVAPNFYAAHNDLGNAYLALGRLSDAELEFLEASRLNKSSTEPLLHLAGLHILRNELDRAAASSLEAIKKDARSAGAFFYLGLSLYCASQFESAENAFRRAMGLHAERPESRLLLINVYIQRRDRRRLQDEVDAYMKEAATAKQKALVKSVRDRLARGDMPDPKFRITFPVQLGSVSFTICTN
jgi:Tfp pilus assembly protein PilF